ncbi:MAG: glycosyltransferase, partial [Lachnospiraceae bacterium]|nr:glycosyltransferase [Lachnospiraceae bacterium]
MGNKISVIVPAYNVENTIEKCLTSILNQTYQNLEIIVVNDGSTDTTRDIVFKMANTDERIHLIDHHINKGLFRARLTGVKVSSGDYISFVDSDDY